MDLKTLNSVELRDQFKLIWGAVAWPGKRPGCAVVLGMDRKEHLGNHDIYLLDEFETFDTRQLVRQCGALDLKYLPDCWIGQWDNDAASGFISEMNDEYEQHNRCRSAVHRRQFSLRPTAIVEMRDVYQTILPRIKVLVNRRQLFLYDNKVVTYLDGIQESEMAELALGEFPAIESLAFGVIEMRGWVERENRTQYTPPRRQDYEPLWSPLRRRR
ncbi:hypothetical protein ACFL5Z_05290 [Planctomycetota bacterium]